MKKWYLFTGILALMMTLAVVSCTKKDDDDAEPSNELDRKPMLENYANNYVLPAYNDMETSLNKLKAVISDFSTNPTLSKYFEAQLELENAYLQWQSTDLYQFGPGEDAQLRSFVNTFPVTVSKVKSNISSGSYDLEAFGNKDAQGFPALDYMLNDMELDMFTTEPMAANRRQYLLDVVTKMADKVSAVRQQWETYKTTFIENTGTDASGSLSQMVNNYVLYYERYLRGGKVGIPAGAMTGTALPSNVESLYTPENSKKYLIAALNAVLRFYQGDRLVHESMKTYLVALGTTDDNGKLIADLVEEEMNQAIQSVERLGGTLQYNIINNKTQVLEAYDEIQDVVPLLKVDMVSAFSISITYTDNDGD